MNKTFQIAGITLKNRYVLAPLAGYSDYSLRYLTSYFGASLNYTEMISAEALVYNSKETLRDINDTFLDRKTNKESKLALQLFGGKKDHILQAIRILEEKANYDFLDFNCGCPVNKVVKQKAGSAWLKRLDELYPLLKEMVSISKKPVILKTRIGFSSILDIADFVKNVESTGVQAIAIHGRTRNELFSGTVHYDVIKKAKEVSSIPVIANGSIDENNFLDVLNETKADAIMIGQKAVGYPKIFKDLIDIEDNKKVETNTLASQLNTLKKQIEIMYQIKDERSASSILRSVSVKYLKGFESSSFIRRRLVQAKSKEEYLTIIDELLNN